MDTFHAVKASRYGYHFLPPKVEYFSSFVWVLSDVVLPVKSNCMLKIEKWVLIEVKNKKTLYTVNIC